VVAPGRCTFEALPCTVQDKDRPLSELQRDRFEDLLRGLSAERRDIRTAMVFALDNAECAAEVVEILTDALTLKETPVPTKVRSRDDQQAVYRAAPSAMKHSPAAACLSQLNG